MAVAEPANFFKQKRSAAEIKAEILLPYFSFWVKSQLKKPQEPTAAPLLYLDMPAGPGYGPEDEPTASMLILKEIAESPGSDFDLTDAVQSYFYDPSESLSAKLQENISHLPFYENLMPPPIVLNPEAQAGFLEQLNPHQPALITLDPFSGSWAGKVLAAAGAGDNTDILMLFSYRKMRQVLLAPAPEPELSYFSEERIIRIRNKDRTEKSNIKREQWLVQEWVENFEALGFFTFKFKINLPATDQISHYLTLASKNKAGYLAFKEIMHLYSEVQEDGVPLFISSQKPQPPLLPGFFGFLSEFSLVDLVRDLAQMKSRFHYQTIQDIYAEHSVGTHYIKRNYLTAFTKLRDMGTVNLVDLNNRKVPVITEATVVFYKLHSPKKL